jgi:dynein heavy chain 2
LESLHGELNETLREFTSHDLSSEPLMQLKMKSLVFDMVHYIDVVEQLQRKKTESLTDWQWKKQLRYYYEKNKAIVKMHDARFEYTYEYQGNAPKLVHTPLTDKCYLTLTQVRVCLYVFKYVLIFNVNICMALTSLYVYIYV